MCSNSYTMFFLQFSVFEPTFVDGRYQLNHITDVFGTQVSLHILTDVMLLNPACTFLQEFKDSTDVTNSVPLCR